MGKQRFYIWGRQGIIGIIGSFVSLPFLAICFALTDFMEIKVEAVIILMAAFFMVLLNLTNDNFVLTVGEGRIKVGSLIGLKKKEFSASELLRIENIRVSTKGINSDFIVLNFSDEDVSAMKLDEDFYKVYAEKRIILIVNDVKDRTRNARILQALNELSE